MLFDTISQELSRHTELWKENGDVLVHEPFFMIRNFCFASKDFLSSTQPYRVQEGRVVIVKSGKARYTFDLVEHEFEAGDVVVFLADTLVEKQGHTDDFEVDALSFDYNSPSLPDMGVGLISLHLDGQSNRIVTQHFDLLWNMAHEAPIPEENMKIILNSMLLYIKSQPGNATGILPTTRHKDTLKRFVNLVSRYAARERSIPFYADKLCLAPHYLSTLIKESSGLTVMHWVNQVAVKEIKVWLAYSDESIAQIAYHLNFPSPSSLSKFFKRETGMTPNEYRLTRP